MLSLNVRSINHVRDFIMHKKLTITELKFLKNIYQVNWPTYLPTFVLLGQFIERFEKHPEWQEKVIFLTIDEETLKCGTFLMIYCNYTVNFNSLEAEPYTHLEKLLNDLDFSEEKKFCAIEVHHAGIIEKILKLQNLEKTFDESSKCFVHDFHTDVLIGEKFVKPPQGFYYGSLKQSDVPQLSAMSRYKMPAWYFENVIKYNATTGLCDNDGKVVAWTAMHETGQTGMINVVSNYRRKKVATGVVLTHFAKMFATGKIIFGHVFDTNEAAMQFFNFVGHMEIIGSHRWMDLRKNSTLND